MPAIDVDQLIRGHGVEKVGWKVPSRLTSSGSSGGSQGYSRSRCCICPHRSPRRHCRKQHTLQICACSLFDVPMVKMPYALSTATKDSKSENLGFESQQDERLFSLDPSIL